MKLSVWKAFVPLCLLTIATSGCDDLPALGRAGQAGPPGTAVQPTVAPSEVAAIGGQPKAPQPARPVGAHSQHDPHQALDPDRLVKVALQHEREGRLELAFKTLADGLSRFPESALLHAVRGSLRLQMQQVSAALGDLEKAVSLAPDDPGIRVNRAQAYRAFGRYEEALADLDAAVSVSPDLLSARFNRGALHHALGDYAQALGDFEHCVAVDPHAAAPYFNRASTQWALGQGEQALRDLDRFLELSENEEWKAVATDLKATWQQSLVTDANPRESRS